MQLTPEQRSIIATALAISIAHLRGLLINSISDEDAKDVQQSLDGLEESLDIIERGPK